MAKKIRGRIIRELYENGRLVERSVDNNAILNADHWRGWRDFDRTFGNAYLRTAFDYGRGEELMDYYSTTNKYSNRKYVYRRAFNTSSRLKK